jgi:ABC-type branched-subunit amino acid transport system ATPase component
MTVLDLQRVTKRFGGNIAVDNVSFTVEAGEMVGLIGPNGSGKTTLVNIMSGHLDPDSGSIRLDGSEIGGLAPHVLARRGVLRMFQMTRLFRQITALDNLIVVGRALGMDADEASHRAHELAADLKLSHVVGLDAGQLSGGQQKLLEFGTCFMKPPRIALLDEPFAAVHPTMRQIMSDFVSNRHAEGQTFILVSHDMPIVRELCARSICMNAGQVLADGATEAVLANSEVIEAYLGGEAA